MITYLRYLLIMWNNWEGEDDAKRAPPAVSVPPSGSRSATRGGGWPFFSR